MLTTKNVSQTLTSLPVTHNELVAERMTISEPIKQLINAKLWAFKVPLKSPIVFNGYRLSTRDGIVVQLLFSDGTTGLGEVSPLPGFSHETLAECIASLKLTLSELIKSQAELTPDNKPIQALFNSIPTAVQFGLDCALAQIPYQFYPVPSQVLLQGLSTLNEQLDEKLSTLARGIKVKLKLGRNSLAEEIALINQLYQLRPDLKLNVDVNRQWQLPQALEFAENTPPDAIDYFEEPCQTLSQSIEFAERSERFIALDESLQSKNMQNQAIEFQPHPKIKKLVIKPSLVGGFGRCLSLIKIAKADNIECMLSSSFESALGLSQLTQLAKRWLPAQTCGFDTLSAMTTDILVSSCADKPLATFDNLNCIWQS